MYSLKKWFDFLLDFFFFRLIYYKHTLNLIDKWTYLIGLDRLLTVELSIEVG